MSTYFQWWERLRASYWFVPGLMALGAIALSFATVKLDEQLEEEMIRRLGWIYTGGPEGARGVLSAIASSTITVAGVTFSITIVTLSLASSQFGPRLLRQFMRDTGNQVVLGAFTSIYLYCLLVLRTVRDTEDLRDVPHLSVTVGVALAVVGVGVLIYFIHHVAESIQVSHIVHAVSEELEHAIRKLFPEKLGLGGNRDRPAAPAMPRLEDCSPVVSSSTGYIENIDNEKLLAVAREHDLLILLLLRPGDFVMPGMAFAMAAPPERVSKDVSRRLRTSFALGRRRTTAQDTEFAFQQLVEMALRALSPAINDPFTAMLCVDHLTARMCNLLDRALPSPYRHDEDGALRLVAPRSTYARYAEVAFRQLAEASGEHSVVRERIRERIQTVRSRSTDPELHATLDRIVSAVPH